MRKSVFFCILARGIHFKMSGGQKYVQLDCSVFLLKQLISLIDKTKH